VASLKSLTTAASWQHGFRGRLWEQSYHDRNVWQGPQTLVVVEYVRNNPVMAGLVETPEEWPWLGTWLG